MSETDWIPGIPREVKLPPRGRRCSLCGETKPLTEFYKNGQQNGGYTTLCKPCFRARQAIYEKRPPREQTAPGTKRCQLCKTVKPDAEFFASKRFHDGMDRVCKHCRMERQKAWKAKNLARLNEGQKRRYRANLDRYADYELKGHFGLPHGTYDKMLAAQDGKCAICGSPSPGNRRLRRFHVDHCHDTGVIRGLLCNNCNRGLGNLQHSERILRSAIEYLAKLRPSQLQV